MKVSPNDNTTDQKNCEKYVDNNKKGNQQSWGGPPERGTVFRLEV